jgi:hypothetical protein
MTARRTTVCFIMRSNDAWLINVTGEIALDRVDSENYAAARSLTVAKRVGREMAIDAGYENVSARWLPWGTANPSRAYELLADNPS